MFSHIVSNINLNHEFTTGVSDLFVEFNQFYEKFHLDYEEASIALNETNKKVAQKEEEYSLVEAECKNLMSELAQHVQNKCDLKNKVDGLKNVLLSTEFDLKKYSRMVISPSDLEIWKDMKKKFIAYKSILKIHFDFSNGTYPTILKGYMFNKLTLRLTYFEFNKEEKTANEISDYLWKKMGSISEKKWKMLAM